MTILVTGSEGLIGYHLSRRLKAARHAVRRFDIRRSLTEDLRDRRALGTSIDDVTGIVHLAAVSRVIWGEHDPANCIDTNVTALDELLKLALRSNSRPWVLFASSREVYGNPDRFPVSEDCPLQPLNVYARTKQEGERRILAAREGGLVTNVARLSSVYGWTGDHKDRVAPAFALAAVHGGRIRIDGHQHTFDFTFIDDIVDGLSRFVDATSRGVCLPVIHFASGNGTSLEQLAEISIAHARRPVEVVRQPSRPGAVSRFVGDPSRAASLLGWSCRTPIEHGMKQLIGQYAAETNAMPHVE